MMPHLMARVPTPGRGVAGGGAPPGPATGGSTVWCMARGFLRRRSSDSDDTSRPVVITGARASYQDELAARKRRYFLLMSIRIPALFLAAGAMYLWNNPWIAFAIVVGSIPIPWIAVIGANDRPPLPKEQRNRYVAGAISRNTQIALPPGVAGATRPTDATDEPTDPAAPTTDAPDADRGGADGSEPRP